jgi:hypothetical protein
MRFTILAVAAAVPAVPGSAHDNEAALMAYLDSEIRSWCQSEEIVAAILRRNAEHAGIDRTRLRELDSAWQAEIGAAETPTISPVIEGPTADFLRARVEAAGGLITEVVVMDAQGLNVAASAVTSHMWQGDEALFTETFGVGADAVHLGEVEFDESMQTYRAQISLTIVDPATGAPIGAITVSVDVEALL